MDDGVWRQRESAKCLKWVKIKNQLLKGTGRRRAAFPIWPGPILQTLKKPKPLKASSLGYRGDHPSAEGRG